MHRVWLALVCLVAAPPASPQEENKKPFDVWALQRVSRITDPQLSPDGTKVAFVVEKSFLLTNSNERHIYIAAVEGGGEPRRLTFEGKSNTGPRWFPDSDRLAYVSDRDGVTQVWATDSGGTAAQALTDFPTGAAGVVISPDGTRILFTSQVFPDCEADNACNQGRLAEQSDRGSGRVYDSLPYREHGKWRSDRRSHLFIKDLIQRDLPVVDLTPGPFEVAAGGYAFSPDVFEVCFASVRSGKPGLSTNSDLFVVPVEGGDARRITDNPAADASPAYSHDGLWIGFRSQNQPDHPGDRFVLQVYNRDTGEIYPLTEALDRPVQSFTWSPDSRRLFFIAEDRGRAPMFTVKVDGGATQLAVYGEARYSDVQLLPDGKSMIYRADSGTSPAEIFRAFSTGGRPQAITRMNEALFQEFSVSALEEVEYDSLDGKKITGFLVKPPGFDYDKKYSLVTLVNPGRYGAWGESWSYDWNAQVFAGAGHLVFLPNPRGAAGFGQAFTDDIRGDWGGRAIDDIIGGIDHLLSRPYVDPTKLAAAGGTFGGYTVNWMLGRTDRFNALVSHGGIFDLRGYATSTDNLALSLWEMNGAPWHNNQGYEQFSPSNFVQNFKTPTLVTHGEHDSLVPATQSLQLFTALQVSEVPSRLLTFPDEGSEIVKPRNRVQWYQAVTEWLNMMVK